MPQTSPGARITVPRDEGIPVTESNLQANRDSNKENGGQTVARRMKTACNTRLRSPWRTIEERGSWHPIPRGFGDAKTDCQDGHVGAAEKTRVETQPSQKLWYPSFLAPARGS